MSTVLVAASLTTIAPVGAANGPAAVTPDRPAAMTADTEAVQIANSFKFVWGAMGDSYGSGEGNPAVAKSKPNDASDFSGLVWSSRANFYNPVALPGVSAAADTTTCHRSSNAPAATVNDRIQSTFGVTAVLGHVACSGATMDDLLNPGYRGPGVESAAMLGLTRITEPAQIDRIATMKSAQGRLDAVYVSIGGNDTGFGGVLASCLAPFSDCRSKSTATSIAIDALTSKYANLDRVIDQKLGSSTPVFISGYPNPLDGGSGSNPPACAGSDYAPYAESWNFGWDSSTANEISRDEAKWAYYIPGRINTKMSAAAFAAGNWTYVDNHVTASLGHGMCTRNPAFNLNSAALHSQGRDVPNTAAYLYSTGFVHPNALGYSYYADAIYAAMLPTITARVTEGLIAPARLRTIDATGTSIVVRWDDRATSENAYELTVLPANAADQSALTMPSGAWRVGNGYRLRVKGSNMQTYTVETTKRMGITVSVAACNLGITGNQCGAPTSDLAATNVLPTPPTSVRYQVLAMNRSAMLSWTPSSTVLEYVVRKTNRTTKEVTTIRSVANPLTVTSPNSYDVDIAACNRAGCTTYVAVNH